MNHQQAQGETLRGLIDFYQSLETSRLDALTQFYAAEARLVDPVGAHQGLTALHAYFAALLKNLRYCRFDVTHSEQVNDGALLLWRMDYAHPALKRGAPLQLEGCSWLRFSGQQIVFQQDYYDLGAMFYEHVPAVGVVIRQLKKRLQQ